MEIGTAPIPLDGRTRGETKYSDLWKAIEASNGQSAVTVSGLTAHEAQGIRVAARWLKQRLSTFRLVSRFEGGTLTLWLEPKQPNVGRQLTAIR